MSKYQYKECGLPNIFLVNGFESKDSDKYGRGLIIHDLKGLHRAIGLDLSEQPARLDRKEIRFLRHEMDMSQRNLGRILGNSEVTVRKWEAGDSNISPTADRLLRGYYVEFVDGGRVLELIAKLNELDRSVAVNSQRVFETLNGWRRKVA